MNKIIQKVQKNRSQFSTWKNATGYMIMVYDWRLLGMVAAGNFYTVYTLNFSENGALVVFYTYVYEYFLFICLVFDFPQKCYVTAAYSFSLYWKIWQYFSENHTEMSIWCIAPICICRYEYLLRMYIVYTALLESWCAVTSDCSKIYPQIPKLRML